MRIAYVCADPGIAVFDCRKGCSIHVQEMLRALRLLGNDVVLFAANTRGRPPADLASIAVHQLPLPARELKPSVREQALLLANESLSKSLENAGYFDLLYERYSLWSFAGMEFAEEQGIPGVLEVNSPLVEEQSSYRTLIDEKSANRVAKSCFRKATVVCAVSDEVGDFVERVIGTADTIRVLPNGVDPSRFPEYCRKGRAYGTPFNVGFVGSLKPWHGVDRLISAFSRVHRKYRASRLLLVGDGPERKNIEEQLASLGLSGVATLYGAVDPAEIPGLLAEMDVGVAPYPEIDGFYFSPMKVYEYMAAGLPVVASEVGQLRQLIVDEVDGLLCPPGDSAALEEALLCLQRDPSLRLRLGNAARAKVIGAYTWTGVASRVLTETRRVTPFPVQQQKVFTHGAPGNTR